MSGYLAVLVIHLHFPEVHDLKSKRREVVSLKSQLHGRLGAAVSETEHQDVWQRATLLAALTGGSVGPLSAAADRVERFVLDRYPDTAHVERHLAALQDLVD